MEEKKYQIFVSSTFTDLEIARKKVIDMILSLYHFPVGMEMFSADDGEQWQTIEQAINYSDYYVVVIGHRYGALANDGYSYTEKEYDLAKANGVPILAFIRNRDIALKDDEREITQEGQKKLDSFIAKAKASKMCDFWSSHEELVGKVSVALHKIFHRNPRTGWIRSSGGVSKETTEELARLSNENRVLREKVENLEMGATLDKPNLTVILNEGEALCLSVSPEYETVQMPRELRLEDVPIEYADYVSEKSIDDYNSKIPSIDELNRYNEDACFYHRVINNLLQINTRIKNSGRMSASNVNVEIDFPNFVMLLSNEEVNKAVGPENIFPVNPIKTAKSRKSLRDFRTSGFSSFQSQLDYITSFNDDIRPLLNYPSVDNSNSWIDVVDNEVDIFERKIMHTKSALCDTFSLIPIKKGEGVIKIKVICEEYKEQANFEIPISVE